MKSLLQRLMKNISFQLCYLLMIVVFLSACANFLVVNGTVRRATDDTLQSIRRIDSLYNKSSDSTSKEYEVQNTETTIDQMKSSVTELSDMRKYLFDSNTITFLSSFVLIFLAGILFDIEKRANNKLSETKDGIERLNIEIMQLDIYKCITTSLVLSKNLQVELASNKYVINERANLLIFEMYKQLEMLLGKLRDKKLLYIIQSSKEENKKCLRDIQLMVEKEEFLENPKNKDKLKPIIKCKVYVSECLKELDRLKTL